MVGCHQSRVAGEQLQACTTSQPTLGNLTVIFKHAHMHRPHSPCVQTSTDVGELETFMLEAVADGTEGLIVKTLAGGSLGLAHVWGGWV